MSSKIKAILKEKGINYIVHFTRVENLPSILKYGLVPRSVLETDGTDYCYNDECRFDNCLDAVCVSIGFPNYKMFYKLRCDYPESKWVVLVLDSSVLYEFDCAFCTTNAGSADVFNIDIDDRKGAKALLQLYQDDGREFSRADQHLKSYDPTNPQAEVLVFNRIPPEFISRVIFQNQDTLKKCADCLDGMDVIVHKDPFSPRCDYKLWQR